MSDPTNIPEQGKKERKKGEALYLILIFLMLCSNGLFGWLWWKDKGQMHIITIEKESVSKDAEIAKLELSALQTDYQNLKVNNKNLQAEIDAKKLEIEKLVIELEKHKDNAWIIGRLRKETLTLRGIMQHFVEEMDSLNTMNKNVIAEREVVKKELKTEKEKNTQLVKEKEVLQETVNIASILKAVGINASAIAEKRGGKKESETKKAKRTDKIKISFTLAENIVAKEGERVIYARIISPDGKEITQADDDSHVFQFENSKGFWATKKNINYANTNTEVVMYAQTKQNEEFVNGKYIIHLACDNATIGNTMLELE